MTDFDDLAADYDRTRGGEPRGDEYAADLDVRLPGGDGTVLEIGTGTGVVALGLRRRGRQVVGVDLSGPMLRRARERLGPAVVLGDAALLPLRTGSVAHAVAVWVVHAVHDPVAMLREAARVVRPGGRVVVCSAQRPAADDPIGAIVTEMGVRADARLGATRPRGVSVEQVLGWAHEAGLAGTTELLDRFWSSTREEELAAIRLRAWPALRRLPPREVEAVTRPAIEALAALPEGAHRRHGVAELLVLAHR